VWGGCHDLRGTLAQVGCEKKWEWTASYLIHKFFIYFIFYFFRTLAQVGCKKEWGRTASYLIH
jgi:hypothetical protein